MLQAMRSGAGSFFSKLLLGLLVVSFALWGVDDAIRGTGGDSTVANVGNLRISASEVEREVSAKTEELRARMGKQFDAAWLKQINLDRLVLEGMIDEALIDREARAQGILVGDAAVQDMIARNPDFQTGGKFDLERFHRLLKANHLGEQSYYRSLRQRVAAQLLTSAIDGLGTYPEALVPLLLAWQGERREADILVFGRGSAAPVPAPSSGELAKFYDTAKNRYTVPEYRTVSYALIDFNATAKQAEISTDELKAAYGERAGAMQKPEARQLEQLLYDSEAKAKQAAQLLAKGETFARIAKQIPPANAGRLNLGALAKSELPREAADAVFALKAGAASAVIHTDFGWHLFRVGKIIPAHAPSLAELRPALEAELRRRSAEENVTRIANQIEDALASGTAFEAAAKQAGAGLHRAGPFDKSGLAPSGLKLAGLTGSKAFLDIAFATDEKSESQAVPADDGSYFILHVESVTPERIRKLEEIKPDLLRVWNENKRRELLHGLAERAVADLKTASSAEVARKLGASLRQSGPVGRNATRIGDLQPGPDFMNDLFSRARGEATSAHALQDGSLAIARVSAILPSAPRAEDKEGKALREELARNYRDELYRQYMRYLREKHDVTIHPERLPKAEEQLE